jgi:TonB family protein
MQPPGNTSLLNVWFRAERLRGAYDDSAALQAGPGRKALDHGTERPQYSNIRTVWMEKLRAILHRFRRWLRGEDEKEAETVAPEESAEKLWEKLDHSAASQGSPRAGRHLALLADYKELLLPLLLIGGAIWYSQHRSPLSAPAIPAPGRPGVSRPASPSAPAAAHAVAPPQAVAVSRPAPAGAPAPAGSPAPARALSPVSSPQQAAAKPAAPAIPEEASKSVSSPPRALETAEPSGGKEENDGMLPGPVVVEVELDAQGQIVDARVLKGSQSSFDGVVLDAVRHWKFMPAIRDGKPVRSRIRATVDLGRPEGRRIEIVEETFR